MSDPPHVAVILLNWNNYPDTIECLESLKQVEYNNFSTIVVDNNSFNNSIEKLREHSKGNISPNSEHIEVSDRSGYGLIEYNEQEALNSQIVPEREMGEFGPVHLIKNPENRGFPGGNNIGIKFAKKMDPDFFLLLNNDTVVDSEFISQLVEVADNEPKAGIVGSMILDYEGDQRIQGFGGKVHWWLGAITTLYCEKEDGENYSDTLLKNHTKEELTGVREREYTWATSQLISKKVIEEIGYLDEDFFFGIEEYDFCERAKKSGYKIFVTSDSKVWHKKGGSWEFLKDDPETRKKIRESKGTMQWKFYYKLFKRHLPPVLFLFPFTLRMIMTIVYRLRKGTSLKRVVPGVE